MVYQLSLMLFTSFPLLQSEDILADKVHHCICMLTYMCIRLIPEESESLIPSPLMVGMAWE